MSQAAALCYRVVVTRDPEARSVVSEIPALPLAALGAEVPEATQVMAASIWTVQPIQEG